MKIQTWKWTLTADARSYHHWQPRRQSRLNFYHDGTSANMAHVTQDWLQANCPRFSEKNNWPPNSPDLNPPDYHVWGTKLEKYRKLHLTPKTTDELKVALQTIWEELPQEHADKVVANFTKPRLTACMAYNDGYLIICSKCLFPSLYHHLSTKKLALFRAIHLLLEETTSKMLKSNSCFFTKVVQQH